MQFQWRQNTRAIHAQKKFRQRNIKGMRLK